MLTNNVSANIAYIGLGSNIGNSFNYIYSAVKKIQSSNKCQVISIASIYNSKPLGKSEQNNYLNTAIKIKCSFSLFELFSFLKKIEINLGRIIRERWDEREIDLDILFFNDLIYEDDKLQIPHPEILNRDFVFVPLIEIEPELMHPFFNKKISDICNKDSDNLIINKHHQKIMIDFNYDIKSE